MKVARLAVLGVALAAGGIAAFLARGGEEPKVEVAAPPPQLETVDVLIARGDIGMGSAVGAKDFHWQAWPAATTIGAYLRRNERPTAKPS